MEEVCRTKFVLFCFHCFLFSYLVLHLENGSRMPVHALLQVGKIRHFRGLASLEGTQCFSLHHLMWNFVTNSQVMQ